MPSIAKNILRFLGLLFLLTVARAENDFLTQLSAEDFAAAGLHKQTPAELDRLKALAARYRAAAPLDVRRPEVSATPQAKEEKKQPIWLTALTTLTRAVAKPEEAEPLESRLLGEFTGWNARTVFVLENDTRWVPENRTDRFSYTPALQSPVVTILPASMGGFWLEVSGVNKRLRVKLQSPTN